MLPPEGIAQKMAAPSAAGLENAVQPAAAPVQAYRAARPYLTDQAAAVGAATGQEIAEPMDSPIANLVGTPVGAQAGGSAFNAATAPARGISSIRDRSGKDKAMMAPPPDQKTAGSGKRESVRD